MSLWVCKRSSSISWFSFLYCSCSSWIAVCFSPSSWYFNSMFAAMTFSSAIVVSLIASSCLLKSSLALSSETFCWNVMYSSCKFKNFSLSFWSSSLSWDLCASPMFLWISILCISSRVSLSFISRSLFSFSFLWSVKRISVDRLLACCKSALASIRWSLGFWTFSECDSNAAILSSDSFSCKFSSSFSDRLRHNSASFSDSVRLTMDIPASKSWFCWRRSLASAGDFNSILRASGSDRRSGVMPRSFWRS